MEQDFGTESASEPPGLQITCPTLVHTHLVLTFPPERNTAMGRSENSGWQRLGAAIREARGSLGFTSRDTFAEVAGVSVRVISDLESGARDNFSEKILSRVEDALGWISGTIDQIVTDPDFLPPAPSPADELVFRPPEFNRKPVLVDVAIVERAIAALTEVSRQRGEKPLPDDVARVAEAAVSLCWPYITRLVEDNVQPGNELHPAVRPLYETFLTMASKFSPADPAGHYVQWLSGDAASANESVRHRYMQRWSESRRIRRGRRARVDTG